MQSPSQAAILTVLPCGTAMPRAPDADLDVAVATGTDAHGDLTGERLTLEEVEDSLIAHRTGIGAADVRRAQESLC